jgi:hypothetical protein
MCGRARLGIGAARFASEWPQQPLNRPRNDVKQSIYRSIYIYFLTSLLQCALNRAKWMLKMKTGRTRVTAATEGGKCKCAAERGLSHDAQY